MFMIPASVARKESKCGICRIDYPQAELLKHFMWHIVRGDTEIGDIDDTSR